MRLDGTPQSPLVIDLCELFFEKWWVDRGGNSLGPLVTWPEATRKRLTFTVKLSEGPYLPTATGLCSLIIVLWL